MDWFAVRHVARNQDAYEERITLWQAENAEDAIKQAEAEAAEYVEIIDGAAVLPLFQSFHLSDPPSSGAEVSSLIRRSPLTPDDYLTTFFDTGTELQERAE
jgi:hypothetical protein